MCGIAGFYSPTKDYTDKKERYLSILSGMKKALKQWKMRMSLVLIDKNDEYKIF